MLALLRGLLLPNRGAAQGPSIETPEMADRAERVRHVRDRADAALERRAEALAAQRDLMSRRRH